jgi:hypothetical protein
MQILLGWFFIHSSYTIYAFAMPLVYTKSLLQFSISILEMLCVLNLRMGFDYAQPESVGALNIVKMMVLIWGRVSTTLNVTGM